MSQQQRNEAIIHEGEGVNNSNLGTVSGLECKPWVQKIVYAASKNAVWIPATSPNDYQWQIVPGDNVIQVTPTTGPIDPLSLQPGWILQLQRTNNAGPHTAIVVMATSSGIVLLDSNYIATNTVGMHLMSWASFNKAFLRYTAYQIQ